MRKSRSLLLGPAVALSLIVAACGGEDPDASTEDTEAPVETEATTEAAVETEATTEETDEQTEATDGTEAPVETEATTEETEDAEPAEVVALDLAIDFNDENQAEVFQELIAEFEAENPGITVEINTVSYAQILEQLPLLMESGEAPDLMRLTNMNLNRHFLDLSPYVEDLAYWEENMGLSNSLMSPDGTHPGGMFMDVTVTGPFINRTLFEQAGVEVPSDTSDEVTWEEWAEASRQVAEATGIDFAMAMDRSGHRFVGPAISQGAEIFDADGNVALVGDEGFAEMVEMMVGWHEDGTMPLDVWAGGDSYQDARPEFVNANLAFYMTGNWQIAGFVEEIGSAFEWEAVPPPCGPGGCTGMPGGSVLVGYAETDHPAEVAAFIDFMAREDIYRSWAESTLQVPQHDGLIAAGLDFSLAPESATQPLEVFSESAAGIAPLAADLLGYEYSNPVYNSIRDRLTQAILGELSIDDAIARMQSDIETAIEGAS